MLLVGTQVLLSKPYTTSQKQSSSKLKYIQQCRTQNKVYGYHNRKTKNFSMVKGLFCKSEKINFWTIIQEWMMRFEHNENMQVKRKDKAISVY